MFRALSVFAALFLLSPWALLAAEQTTTSPGEVVHTQAWVIEEEPGPAAVGEEQVPETGGEVPAAIEIEIPIPEHREGQPMPLEQVRAVTYDRATGTVSMREPSQPLGLPQWIPGAPGVGQGPGLRPRAENLVSIVAPDFGGLSRITSNTDYPWRANVRLRVCFPYQGSTVCGGCSGALVDSMHVLTAGHCVYAHTIGTRTINSWASSIQVSPGYDAGTQPFGSADFTQLHSYNGWTNSEDFDYDIGFIDLDRPVGSLTGWLGYGYNDSCSFYTGNTFDNPGYPGDPPYTGELMYNWSGTFDDCESILDVWYGNEVEIESYCYGGQSGSNAFRTRTNPIVRSVLSNGNSTSCYHVRLTSTFFSDIGSWITADTPSTPDLIPLRVTASPTSISAGSQLSQLNYVVHNNSTGTWAASFTAKVYLSTNNVISTGDRLIQTHGVSVQIGPKGSVVVNVSPAPTIPADVGSGSHWLGVILDVSDANNTNNTTGTQDAFAITVQALPTVTATAPDATATEAGPTTGTFRVSRTGSTGSSLTVNYTVGGSATPNSDYLALPGSITIPAGSSSADFNVNPINDSLIENDETVLINLASGSYTIGTPSSATITIVSDDTVQPATVTITAPDSTATEAGPTGGLFRVSRSGSTSSSLVVNLSSGGSATPGSDYSTLPGSITIPAGSSSADVPVTPIDDSAVEPDESVVLSLVSGSGYVVGSPSSATVTLVSNDSGGSSMLFQDDMEGGTERWSPQAPWTRTTGTSHSPSRSWTDSLASTYGNGVNVSLFTQPVDLRSATAALLTFWHRYDVETGFDFAQVWATADGGVTWTRLRSFTGTNLVWSPATVDLGSFAGQSAVTIAFQLLSDTSITQDGWYVDDVSVYARPANDFYTVVPCRVVDTRNVARLTSGIPLVVNAAQVCGVPSSARAVALNVTAISPSGTGQVTLYPSDQALPGTSTLSFSTGQTRATLAFLMLSTDGKLSVYPYVTGDGQVDLLLDVSGYFQ